METRGRGLNELAEMGILCQRARLNSNHDRSEYFFRLDGYYLLAGNFYKAAIHLQAVFVAQQLIPRYGQALAAAQHHVFGAQRWSQKQRGQEQSAYQKNQLAIHAHDGASRKAKSSMAAATPSLSLLRVSCQPKVFSSATQFSITTGIPAKFNISRSL